MEELRAEEAARSNQTSPLKPDSPTIPEHNGKMLRGVVANIKEHWANDKLDRSSFKNNKKKCSSVTPPKRSCS